MPLSVQGRLRVGVHVAIRGEDRCFQFVRGKPLRYISAADAVRCGHRGVCLLPVQRAVRKRVGRARHLRFFFDSVLVLRVAQEVCSAAASAAFSTATQTAQLQALEALLGSHVLDASRAFAELPGEGLPVLGSCVQLADELKEPGDIGATNVAAIAARLLDWVRVELERQMPPNRKIFA